MKVGVIAAEELRDRQRFISKPLLQGGHSVCVVKTRPFIKFLYQSVKLIFNNKPDVIVFMGTGAKELLVYGFVKLTGVPFIVRLGGDSLKDLESIAASLWNDNCYVNWLKYQFDILVTRFFLKRVGAVIVVNEALIDKLAKQLKTPYQTFVIPQFCEGGLKTKKYTLNKPIELLTVANLQFAEKAEGIIWIIKQLVSFVHRHRVEIHFCVAGAGQHLKDVEAYISTLKSDFLRVDILGFISDLDTYYSKADAFVYRSFHDATPNVILESKRFGLPLLANDCQEFRTIVNNGISGLLFQNTTDFYKMLQQILTDEEFRSTIGKSALIEHKNKFSIEAAQKKIEAALIETITIEGRH